MADRYWRGGSGTWNNANTTNWSATSGGAGGASIPTSADNVFFDANSTGTCTIAGTVPCANLNFTGFTGTLAQTGTTVIQVYGNLTLVAGMTYSPGGAAYIEMMATTTGKTINTGTKNTNIRFNGIGGEWILQADAGVSTLWDLRAGTLNTNGFTFTIAGASSQFLSTNGTDTKVLNLGSSTIAMGNQTATFDLTGSNLTVNGSGASITSTATSVTQNIRLGGNSFLSFSSATLTTGTIVITGNNTFGTLDMSAAASVSTGSYVLGGNQTVTGTFTLSGGGTDTQRILLTSDVPGTQRTITAATVSAARCIIQDVIGAGAGNWNLSAITGGSGDAGNNSGIIFTPAANQYWVGSATTWTTTSRWASASGGTGGTGRVPLPQDTAIFDANSFGANGGTLTMSVGYVGNIDMSAIVNTVTVNRSTNLMRFFGDMIYSNNVTHSGGNTTRYAGRGAIYLSTGTSAITTPVIVNMPANDVMYLSSDAYFGSSFALDTGTFDCAGFDINTNNQLQVVNGTAYFDEIIGSSGALITAASVGTTPTITLRGPVNLAAGSNSTFGSTPRDNFNIYVNDNVVIGSNLNFNGGRITVKEGKSFSAANIYIAGASAGGGSSEFTATFAG